MKSLLLTLLLVLTLTSVSHSTMPNLPPNVTQALIDKFGFTKAVQTFSWDIPADLVEFITNPN